MKGLEGTVTLPAAETALVIVDVLVRFESGLAIAGWSSMLNAAAALVWEFRRVGALVCHVHDVPELGEAHLGHFKPTVPPGREITVSQARLEEVNGAFIPRDGEWEVEKCDYDAFYSTELLDLLMSRVVKNVVFVGQWLELCLTQTFITAVDEGFCVYVPRVAVASGEPDWKDARLATMRRVLGIRVVEDVVLAGNGTELPVDGGIEQ